MAASIIDSLDLKIVGLDDADLRVFRVDGVAAISEPFQFKIQAISNDPSIEIEAVLGTRATLEMQRQGRKAVVHGFIRRFSQKEATEFNDFIYTFSLEPRLNLLAGGVQTEVHGTDQEMTVVDVISGEVIADAVEGSSGTPAARLTKSDFDVRIADWYPAYDYIVQYRETDLDFLNRMCEHFGIFYFFEHHEGRDVVVFGDKNTFFRRANPALVLRYTPKTTLANYGEDIIGEFEFDAHTTPQKIILQDYNYETPHVPIRGEAVIDPRGHGTVTEFGGNIRTQGEADEVAEIRAQEIRCHSRLYRGRSNSMDLTVGHLFTLDEHFRPDLNVEYVVTRLTHEITVDVPGVQNILGEDMRTAYSNTFECLPVTTPFRPRRVTPKPVVSGVMRGIVDGEGDGARAEIDASGRYKVRLLEDLRSPAPGKASKFIRKAEVYAGKDGGMHFPLLKGTEVIVVCIDGDPDRPVILAALPNELNKSVVVQKSQTANRIKTPSGVLVEIEDGSVV
jgi:type VI secretion system VgrG family protein